jgi:hypothetical protein
VRFSLIRTADQARGKDCGGMVDRTREMNSFDSTIQRFNESRGDSPIIRSALEVNPFLTISALAERIVENIVASLSH